MNTFQNLVDNGIDPHTAQSMLDDYSKRIGTMNGIYEITDITYDFTERGRDVTLKCSLCGREIHRMMIAGRNKWRELTKHCVCQTKGYREALAAEKIAKEKKDMIVSRIGQIHGDYEIISAENLGDNPRYIIRCTECGAEKSISAIQQAFENRTDFRCRKHYVQPVKFDESYIGRKNNFLAVVGITRTEKNRKLFVCECDCGNMTLVEPALWEQGVIKSCGCKRIDLLRESSKKENPVSGMRLYHVYQGMKDRCYNPNNTGYENYGGRGISICPEWLGEHGFENFAKWAYPAGYDENAEFGECTIERKDVNGNYCPENCTWVTNKQQQRNKRTNVFVTINGETKILSDWQKELGISSEKIKRIANGEPERRKNQDKFISFRLTKKEMEHLRKQSAILGISISEYVRRLIMREREEELASLQSNRN